MSGFTNEFAYAIMWYACVCGHQEKVFNARDGTISQQLVCPSCGKPRLNRVTNMAVEINPNHVPHWGQKYFRDGTLKEAAKVVDDTFAILMRSGAQIPDGLTAEQLKIQIAHEHASPGFPVIDVYGEFTTFQSGD